MLAGMSFGQELVLVMTLGQHKSAYHRDMTFVWPKTSLGASWWRSSGESKGKQPCWLL